MPVAAPIRSQPSFEGICSSILRARLARILAATEDSEGEEERSIDIYLSNW
jgi:hypothetical protein